MTFKDLRKRIISNSSQQQTQYFDRLQNKPFWIWDIQEHKQEDIRTKGECCFNHIIGLPTKERLEKPIFDYQQLLYEALLSPDICNPLYRDFKDKQMLSTVWDLFRRFGKINKIYIDGSNPSFIRALKIQIGEDEDYEEIIKEAKSRRQNYEFSMDVVPVSFAAEHKSMLSVMLVHLFVNHVWKYNK